MFAFLKKCFSHSATGTILALLALFLMADTFYLNTVRDQKAETLEAAEQALESYQESLQTESNPGSLKPYLQRFHYGSFLKAALNDFNDAHNTLQITEIHVEQTQEASKETLSFSRVSSKKEKALPETILTLRGQILGSLENEAPYQQLNEILGTIGQETGCTLQLFKGSEASLTETDKPRQFQFELQLVPFRQKQCWQRYTQPQESS